MWIWKCVSVCCLLWTVALCADPELEEEELRARTFLQHINGVRLEEYQRLANAEWNYQTNLTEPNKKHLLDTETVIAESLKKQWDEVIKFKWQGFRDNDIKRQFKMLSILGPAILSEEKFQRNSKLVSEMQELYSTAKVCDYKDSKKCDLPLNPDLESIIRTSKDPEELKHIWVEWRKAVGQNVRQMYKEHIELDNESARLNNFTDTSEYWLSDYDTADIKDQIEMLWKQMKPLYLQIHAYVRHQMRKTYGDLVPEKGPIPAHLTGNMWAQSWEHFFDQSKPYPNKKSLSITEEMVKQNYDYLKIFKTAEEFFVSLNLTAMPPQFWEESMLQKPTDREVVCHASAMDFFDGKNFRIKQCTQVKEEDLFVAHHEMGHIEYFLQYAHQPAIYRGGANEGFHEAIGDVIALSVRTSKHLKKIGLASGEDDPESDLNNLYFNGLSKITFLPFAYVMDLWRWGVFSNDIQPQDYNCKWWKLVEDYQGIEPPLDRSEDDFDPASKYHIVANVPYIRYFVSYVIQFQFHRALCIKAGEYVPNDPSKPLHECDIYQSTEAGNVLGKMLQMGASRPWQDAMEVVTGQRNMDASGILDYFKPLQDWLEAENKKNGVFIGWEPSKRVCSSSRNDNKPSEE